MDECQQVPGFGHKHSEKTKRAIALGNTGKKFTDERRANIAEARLFKPSDELLTSLRELWSLEHLSSAQIRETLDLSGTVYARLKREFCTVKQHSFMPPDMTVEELALLRRLGEDEVYYEEVAKRLDRGKKQVASLLVKLGIKPVTRNPNRVVKTSSIELLVGEHLTKNDHEVRAQFPLGRFYFDYHVLETNLLIEVNGDYWHCNPSVYTNGPVNAWQKKAIRRDFAKRDLARKSGYRRLVVWENDLKRDKEGTLEALLEEIRRHAATIDR